MHRVIAIDYERKSSENLNRALIRRRYARAINEALKGHSDSSVILLEAPVENYFEANLSSVKSLLNNGFEGVYLSFQRPFKNVSALFEQQDIDINKLLIIDGATSCTGEINEKNSRCIDLSKDLEAEDIAKTICSSLNKLKSKNRFVFVDSLTTMALYEPLSKAGKFPDFLMNTIRKNEIENIVLLFNVAEDLMQNRCFGSLSSYADEYIHLGLCT